MTLFLYPTPTPILPALNGFSVRKKPVFANIVQQAVTGREITAAVQSYPLWEFDLVYEILRSQTQNQVLDTYKSPFTEFEQLATVYLVCSGPYGRFYYDDLSDNSRLGQVIGTADGVSDEYRAYRSIGSTSDWLEPVGGINDNETINIYFDGVLQSTSIWSVSSDKQNFVFTSPPGAGVVITADFYYYYLCQFLDDTVDFEQFMSNRWAVKSLKFRSVKGTFENGAVPQVFDTEPESPPPPAIPDLAPAGDTIPTGSNLSPVAGMTRAQIFRAFSEAVGFSGAEAVYGWQMGLPTGPIGDLTLSCWVNFGVQNILGWTPVQDVGDLVMFNSPGDSPYTQESIFGVGGSNLTAYGLTVFQPGVPDHHGPICVRSSYKAPYPPWGGSIFEWPLDNTSNAGWCHLMAAVHSIATTSFGGPHTNVQIVIYINDTELMNDTLDNTVSPGTLSPDSEYPISADAVDLLGFYNIVAGGLYGALSEFWLDTQFIDPSNPANREKFHISNLALDNYAPCDLGPTGDLPTGSAPFLYLTGNSLAFPINRVTGEALLVFGTLIDVDDPPS